MPRIERKISEGCVIQTFCDGKCITQRFMAGNLVEWEDEEGNPLHEPDHLDVYHMYDMLQPDEIVIKEKSAQECTDIYRDRIAWKCSKCNRTLNLSDWTYGSLADSGTPVCECGEDMEYVPD